MLPALRMRPRSVRTVRLGSILTTLGLLISIVVGVLVYGQVSAAQRVLSSVPATQVVVAATDIAPHTEIAASMLTVTNVSDTLMQAGAVTRVEDVAGKFTPDGFARGEVITSRRLGPVELKNNPSYTIADGKVMYVMPVSFTGQPLSIAQVNALRPGDRVDLLYTTIDAPQDLTPDQRDQVKADPIPYLQTRIMLQDLQIQQIGSFAADGSLVPATSASGTSVASANIIFVVTPEEALVLKWLKDAATFYRDSNVEMVLRAPTDNQLADSNLVVNFNYMQQKYNLAPPPQVAANTPH